MAADVPSGSPEPTASRPREAVTGTFVIESAVQRLVGPVQRSRTLRAVLLLLPALVTGGLLAPQLAGRSYPTDPALVGTPAAENIKAPFDLDVVDVGTTERLRQEAEAGVRRVYDLDAVLGNKLAEQVSDAFAFGRDRAAAPRSAALEDAPRPVEALGEGVESRLGARLESRELTLLEHVGFSAEVEAALRKVVQFAMAQPIIAARTLLEPDAGRGITVERVPDNGSAPRTISQVDDILELDQARREVASHPFGEGISGLKASDRDLLAALASRLVRPNLTLNRAATEQARERAREGIKAVTLAAKKGEMIVRDGERISPRHLLILQALSKSGRRSSAVVAALGAGVLVLILVLVGVVFGAGQTWGGDLKPRDLLFLVVLFAAATGSVRLWGLVAQALHERFAGMPLDVFLYAMPLASAALITRLVLRTEVALLVALMMALVTGLLAPTPAILPLFVLAGSVLGVARMRHLSARSSLVRAGLWIGVAQAAVAVGAQLYAANPRVDEYFIAAAGAFLGGLVSAFVVVALTPAVESLFGYTTDLKLLELANLNHPALKELLVQAPGSYHHSVVVGSLVEAAAEAIGANPLMARVMAYYHDLGKGCNPAYFIENQRGGQNPHDKLKPQLSATVIRRHVTDGMEIARRHRLGELILAGIQQHHGTTLIHFFYTRAKEAAEEGAPPAEGEFRYPGRKPQTREAALVMLGDSVEAASRSLADPSPARMQGLVNRIINLKFADGQLEECDLTLRDLHTIAKSFTRVLNSIYHQRVEYPELLKDITGTTKKTQNGDSDQKPPKSTETPNPAGAEDRTDNLRRLGLS